VVDSPFNQHLCWKKLPKTWSRYEENDEPKNAGKITEVGGRLRGKKSLIGGIHVKSIFWGHSRQASQRGKGEIERRMSRTSPNH